MSNNNFSSKTWMIKRVPSPGGPYLIQMLFKEPVDMPDKETMTAVIEKHIGSTECFCYDKQMTGFAAQEHIADSRTANARYS